jgi:hypothetical protein
MIRSITIHNKPLAVMIAALILFVFAFALIVTARTYGVLGVSVMALVVSLLPRRLPVTGPWNHSR